MITRETVFVVGAGASVPYGMPAGLRLMDAAKALSQTQISEYLPPQMRTGDAARNLAAALRQSADGSLDALLEHREDIRKAGKVVMARLLLRAEALLTKTAAAAAADTDWLRYLWGILSGEARNPDHFSRNKASFVTFNYDRIIEHRLIGALRAGYRADDDAIRGVLEDVPVIHLHGSLGLLPEVANQTKPQVPFGLDLRRDQLEDDLQHYSVQAAGSIQIVQEANPTTAEFERARTLLRSAEVIVFLGFGFGRDNCHRLALKELRGNCRVIRGTYGMTDSEVGLLAHEPFLNDSRRLVCGDLPATKNTWDCLQLLREFRSDFN